MRDPGLPHSASKAKLLCPAKINIFLKVISKRPDGYHDIYSLMQPVSLYDELTIEVADGDGIALRCPGTVLPEDSKNLGWRAAELFLSETGLKRKVTLEIKKNIPVGAGLGGGSSDAAGVLMGLDGMLSAGLGEERLMDLAARLGSDCPFFILRSPALASGRGEVLKKTDLPGYFYILINPGFQVSTAWAYNNFALTKGREDNILTYSNGAFREISRIPDILKNDLEAVTAEKHPEIAELKRELIEAGARGALMSGSGPTVFGVFPQRSQAEAAFERLKARLDKKHSIFLVQGLG